MPAPHVPAVSRRHVRGARRVPVVLAGVVVAGLLAACTTGEPVAGPTGTTGQSAGLESSTSPAPEPRHPLSGVAGGGGQPILVVKIDNTRNSRPHAGLAKADLVYVEQVEAGITRFAAVFSSRLPDVVGPIRSARSTDIDLLRPFGTVAFAYSGAQRRLRPVLAQASFIDVSGDRGAYGYYRDRARTAPYNFMGRPADLLARAGDGVSAATMQGFPFDPEPTAAGSVITGMTARWPAQKVSVTWVAGTGWVVSVDGRELPAAEGGRIVASTVVVQYVEYVDSGFGDKWGNRTPEARLQGTGKALVLRDGRAITATWERTDPAALTRYLDGSGEPIPFVPGSQWILLVPLDREVTLERPTPTATSGSTASGTASPGTTR